MPIQFDASEVRQLSADIERGAERVGRNVSQAVKASAERVKTAGQSNAPVGPTVRYGLFVEKGTSKMAAQPFMAPALEAEAPGFQKALADALGEVLG